MISNVEKAIGNARATLEEMGLVIRELQQMKEKLIDLDGSDELKHTLRRVNEICLSAAPERHVLENARAMNTALDRLKDVSYT